MFNPGKWWVVGSAWAGRNPNDKKDNRAENEDDGLVKGDIETANISSALLEKAKKLRMNTEIRKNIFCIIMTCEVSFFKVLTLFPRFVLKPFDKNFQNIHCISKFKHVFIERLGGSQNMLKVTWSKMRIF